MRTRSLPSGFSITEVIVAIAVLAILAGTLAPVAIRQLGKAKQSRALQDLANLAESVQTFRSDVKHFPDRSGGNPGQLGFLLTNGDSLDGTTSWLGPAGDAEDHLVTNAAPGGAYPTSGISNWKGPYLPATLEDPWGNPYIISLAGLRGDSGYKGWILSAGPNGVLETDDGAAEISSASDDLGWRIR